jgi:hypothetical protein
MNTQKETAPELECTGAVDDGDKPEKIGPPSRDSYGRECPRFAQREQKNGPDTIGAEAACLEDIAS